MQEGVVGNKEVFHTGLVDTIVHPHVQFYLDDLVEIVNTYRLRGRIRLRL